MENIVLAILMFIIIILILGMTIPIYKKHREVTDGIINYDATMRKFVYKTNLKHEDIVKLLSGGNEFDDISCVFDFDISVIKFCEYGSNREYYFQVKEYDGFSIIRLEQVALIGMRSHIPYKLNPFMVSKLQAQIVPFSEYGF